MATYNANISVKVAGLTQLDALERKVSGLLRTTEAVTAAFSQLKVSSEATQSLKGVAESLGRATRAASSLGTTTRRAFDPRLVREQAEQIQRQVDLLRERNKAAGDSASVAAKLNSVQRELNKGTDANLQLTRAQIRNANELLKLAERENKVLQEQADKRREMARQRRSENLGAVGQAVTGGGGVRGTAIRGGLAAGGFGLAKLGGAAIAGTAASQLAQQEAVLNVANYAGPLKGMLQGVAAAIPQVNPGLAEMARQMSEVGLGAGAAAVAVAALLPFFPQIAQGTVAAAKGTAQLMQALEDTTFGTVNMELQATNLQLELLTQNLRESAQARKAAGNGFRDFSSGIEEQLGIDKARRRNLDRRMRGYSSSEITPTLALPSSEMLNAGARGIQQLVRSEEELAAATAQTAAKQELVINGIERRAQKLQQLKTYESKVSSWENAYGGMMAGPGNDAGEAAFLANRRRQEGIRQRNYGIRTGIGAGLSLANIPGQAIFQATSIGGAVGGAPGAIAGAATGSVVALGQFAVKASEVAAESDTLQQRLKLLSNGFDDFAAVSKAAADFGEKFGLSQNEAAEQFGNAYARLRPLGATLEEVKTITEGFNTATRLAGASTAEAAGAYTQLLQGLGSGALRGQELNSVLEQAPLLAKAIADEVGTTVGQLREFGKEGELSSDVVLRALKRVADEGASKLADSLDNPIQKTKDLQNAWQKFQIALGPILVAARNSIVKFATDTLAAITPLLDKLTRMLQLSQEGKNERLYALNKNDLPEAEARLAALWKQTGGKMPQKGSYLDEQIEQATKAVVKLREEEKALKDSLYGNPTTNKAPGLAANTAAGDKDAKDEEAKEKALYDYSAQNQAALAENQLALNRQVFENDMALSEAAYRKKLEYQNKLRGLQSSQLTGAGAREFFDRLAQSEQEQQQYTTRLRELDNQIKQAEFAVREAEAGVAIAGMSAQGTRTNGPASGKFKVLEYLTGDKSSSGYRQDHGGGNYHDHIAFGSQAERDSAAQMLRNNGIQIGSMNDGRHAPGSYHYSNQAFDVPGAQVPVGQEPALSQRVRAILGIGGSGGIGNQAIAPGGQANMGGIIGAQGNVDQAKAALEGTKQLREQGLKDIEKLKALDLPKLIADTTQAYRDQTQSLQEETAALKLRTGLEMEGVQPELIQGELDKLRLRQELETAERAYTAAVEARLDADGKATAAIKAYRDANAEAVTAVQALTQARIAAADPINQLIGQWKREIADTRGQIASLAQTVQGELASAMSSAITNVIQGTGTVQEAFSQMFANIGKAFIDMATKILAQKLILSVLGLFGGGATSGVGTSALSIGKSFAPSFAGGGYTGDGARAGGMDGKGGYLAMLHPQEVVTDLFGASRDAVSSTRITSMEGGFDAEEATGTGEAVASTRASLRETERIRENRMQMMTRQLEADRRYERESIERMASTPGNLNVKYESQVINNVEYVTREQAERMSTQSALRGRELAIGALQTSVKTRKRVGMK